MQLAYNCQKPGEVAKIDKIKKGKIARA